MQERSAPDSGAVVRHGARSTGERSVLLSLLRGARLTCPACGKGAMFRRYLKVADTCPACGEELHHHRADDAPPYFTIVIVGHVVVGSMLAVEMAYRPPLWLHAAIWLPLTVFARAPAPAADQRRAGRPAMGPSHARLRSQCRRGEDRALRRRDPQRPGPLMA
jgi:uncharacterized protein (DUF983 family)